MSGSFPSDHGRPLLPLIPTGFVCDSKGADSPVELTTSWLAANLFHGCSFGCTYCFRYRWHPEKEPTPSISPEDALALLLAHPSFVAGITPVTVNVSSTDPLHPRVRASTLEFARLMDERGLTNPFGIVTKGFLSPTDARKLSSLSSLRPVVLTSYSGMPTRIEPIPVERRLASMHNAVEVGLPLIVSYKPIVPGWNDSEDQIRAVMTASSRATAIIMGGLRLDESIARSIVEGGESLPFDIPETWGEKSIPAKVRDLILQVHGEVCPTVPLYDHTSCAVSLAMKVANYNDLRKRDRSACSATCPARQVLRCSA